VKFVICGTVLTVSRSCLLRGLLVLVLFLAFAVSTRPANCQVATPQNNTDGKRRTFLAHLASGEYSVARDLIRGETDPRNRDEMLSRLAIAQRQGGASRDAFGNAAAIGNDLQRLDTLTRISSFGSGSNFDPGDGFGAPPFDGPPDQPDVPRAAGGITAADFDELIELIEETIDPDSWEANGGTGRMRAFPSGVFVDAKGVLKRIEDGIPGNLPARIDSADLIDDLSLTRETGFRAVSLTRLERALQLLAARGERPSPEMMTLGGIYRLTHVMFYPETRDVVIGGPAGPWHYDSEGRAIHTESGSPTLNLDDLVVCFRNAVNNQGQFSCSIDPVPANLARAREVADQKGLTGKELKDRLKSALGLQEVTVTGIDRNTHAGRIIVEADYHMKLVGMGVVPTVPGVDDYFGRLVLDDKGSPPQTDSLVRWWFAMNYESVQTNKDRSVFAISGKGVKLLSESEFWTETGERVHTGVSSPQASGFAQDFTAKFEDLAKKYPVYGELRNLFDCALAANLIVEEGIDRKIDWHLNHFRGKTGNRSICYQPAREAFPLLVEPVAGQRVLTQNVFNRKIEHTVTNVSGGVEFNASAVAAASRIKVSDDGSLALSSSAVRPETGLPVEDWSWDAR
jgi:Protein of unknown function (DUF1598)